MAQSAVADPTRDDHDRFLHETVAMLDAWVGHLKDTVAQQRPIAEALVQTMRARAAPALTPEQFPLPFDEQVTWLMDIGGLAVSKAAAEAADYLGQYRLRIETARAEASGALDQ